MKDIREPIKSMCPQVVSHSFLASLCIIWYYIPSRWRLDNILANAFWRVSRLSEKATRWGAVQGLSSWWFWSANSVQIKFCTLETRPESLSTYWHPSAGLSRTCLEACNKAGRNFVGIECLLCKNKDVSGNQMKGFQASWGKSIGLSGSLDFY